MKINYAYKNKKEVRRALNKALGLAMQKWRIKHHLLKRVKSLTQICIVDCLLCFIGFFIMYALFNFGLDGIATIVFLLLFFLFLFFLFQLFYYLYFGVRIKDLEGEIRFSQDGIVDTSESGKVVSVPWEKVQVIFVWDDIICIFAKWTVYFFPYSKSNFDIVLDAIHEYKPDVSVIEYEWEENGFKRFFWNIGIYVFLFIISLSFSIGFDVYNQNILYDEIEKTIDEREVDFHIYSHQKYGIVEKYVKEYYAEYYKLEEEYLSYTAKATLEQLDSTLFHENRSELDTFIKNLAIQEQKANEALNKMIAMYDREKALELISKEELEEFYEELYLNLLFTENDEEFIRELEEERNMNAKKMKVLKELIDFLFVHVDDWVMEDRLYFYHTEYAEEYNQFYYFIMDETKMDDGVFM